MSISYTHEKLLVAATTLATGQGELQDRLRGAYNSALIRLRSDDLPEGAVRKAFEAIRDDLTWVSPRGTKGRRQQPQTFWMSLRQRASHKESLTCSWRYET